MYTQEHAYMAPWHQPAGTLEEQYNQQGMPAMMEGAYVPAEQAASATAANTSAASPIKISAREINASKWDCQVLYPEVYYKIQPHILMMCDEMDTYGCVMPSKDMMLEMVQQIQEGVLNTYPELESYCQANRSVSQSGQPQASEIFGGSDGIFGDFLSVLLLQELFRRRRRW